MEKKIKSALELAMEQTAGLKELHRESPGEQFEPYFKAAALLANSFLKGQSTAEKIADTIGRYPEGAREKASRILLENILAAMKPNHGAAAAGIYRRFRGPQEKPLLEGLEGLERKYQEKLVEAQGRADQGLYQKELLGPLNRDGISGSALDGVNLERSPWWQEYLQGLAEEFQPMLDRLKEQLLAALK